MRYDASCFGGRSREDACKALQAEGIFCFPGYPHPLSESPGLQHHRSKYPDTVRVLDCPNAEDVCRRSIWLSQETLLAEEKDMDDIVDAVNKMHRCFNA